MMSTVSRVRLAGHTSRDHPSGTLETHAQTTTHKRQHMAHTQTTPLIGFAAWSGTGKTTLLTQLIAIFRDRGMAIGVIKHAHHRFDVDYPGKDSYELRKAGAARTLIASDSRQVRIVETETPDEPVLGDLVAALGVADLDLVLVEGFRHLQFTKIELYRPALGRPLMYPTDQSIVAIASDVPLQAPIPTLDLNKPQDIAAFITTSLLGLSLNNLISGQ